MSSTKNGESLLLESVLVRGIVLCDHTGSIPMSFTQLYSITECKRFWNKIFPLLPGTADLLPLVTKAMKVMFLDSCIGAGKLLTVTINNDSTF